MRLTSHGVAPAEGAKKIIGHCSRKGKGIAIPQELRGTCFSLSFYFAPRVRVQYTRPKIFRTTTSSRDWPDEYRRLLRVLANQYTILSPKAILRASKVLLIVPKSAWPRLPEGRRKFGRLSRLKASARNST